MKLGEALVKAGMITKEQLRLGLERQVIFGGRIGTNLVELKVIREDELVSFLSKFLKIPSVDPEKLVSLDNEIISCVSREIAEKYKAVPFLKERNRLHVALLDPRSIAAVDELRFITGYDIIPYVTSELRLLYALEKYYGLERDLRYISIFGREGEQEQERQKDSEESKKYLAKVKEEFANVKDRDEIIGLLLNETKKNSSRAAIFIQKGDKLTGWRSRGIDAEKIEIEIEPTSIFAEVLNRKNFYRGPLLKIPGNKPLISLLSGAPQDCCLIPIQLRDRIIALLYVDNGNNAVMDAGLSYIHTLVLMASYSFEIAIIRRKILDL
ncbi:MAG: hypothetical protein OEW04_01295 [Nitrospirota bacterium]|nr:hypothetical protein [Nitrospirota bacterium]